MDALSKPFFSEIAVENSSEVSGNNNHRFLIRIELGVLLGFCFRRAYLPRCYSCHNSKVITLGYLRWLVIYLTVQQLLINFVSLAFISLLFNSSTPATIFGFHPPVACMADLALVKSLFFRNGLLRFSQPIRLSVFLAHIYFSQYVYPPTTVLLSDPLFHS